MAAAPRILSASRLMAATPSSRTSPSACWKRSCCDPTSGCPLGASDPMPLSFRRAERSQPPGGAAPLGRSRPPGRLLLPNRAGQGARRGQTAVEFTLVYGLVLLPLTFMFVFSCEMLWVWHSVAEWTRQGAKYAATHCFQSDGDNVRQWMRSHVPLMVDRNRFREGEVDINVDYFNADPSTGELTAFSCDGTECSTECVPETVRVTVANYEFRRMLDV